MPTFALRSPALPLKVHPTRGSLPPAPTAKVNTRRPFARPLSSRTLPNHAPFIGLLAGMSAPESSRLAAGYAPHRVHPDETHDTHSRPPRRQGPGEDSPCATPPTRHTSAPAGSFPSPPTGLGILSTPGSGPNRAARTGRARRRMEWEGEVAQGIPDAQPAVCPAWPGPLHSPAWWPTAPPGPGYRNTGWPNWL